MKSSVMKYSILLFLCLGIVGMSAAQEQLSKADAVKILLEQNYGVKVAENNLQIAKNNTNPGNNGYLPTLNATAGGSGTLGGSNQQFSNGNEAEVNNALNVGANASLSANYTIFDRRRDNVRDQLRELVELSDMELRQVVEANLLQLFSSYYEVARLTENLVVQEQTMGLSRRRLDRAQYRYEFGQGIRLDVLNAQVDIQRDSINYLNLQQQLANAKRNLNVVLGRSVDIDFQVDTVVTYADDLTLSGLFTSAAAGNIDLLITNKNLVLSNYDLEGIDREFIPTVGANASYDMSIQDNAEGSFITSSNSRGLTVGLNLSWNIFDGGSRNVRRQNTQVNIMNQRILKEQLLQELQRDITNTWETYQNALFILEAERLNLSTNELNFQRTEEQLGAGQIGSVEFRQAQLNLLEAARSYSSAKYDAKVLEIQLLQLSGQILEVEF